LHAAAHGTAGEIYVLKMGEQMEDCEGFLSRSNLPPKGGLLVGIPILVTLVRFVREVRRRFREDADEMTYWLRARDSGGQPPSAVRSLRETRERVRVFRT
jgi:hypothetical protein